MRIPSNSVMCLSLVLALKIVSIGPAVADCPIGFGCGTSWVPRILDETLTNTSVSIPARGVYFQIVTSSSYPDGNVCINWYNAEVDPPATISSTILQEHENRIYRVGVYAEFDEPLEPNHQVTVRACVCLSWPAGYVFLNNVTLRYRPSGPVEYRRFPDWGMYLDGTVPPNVHQHSKGYKIFNADDDSGMIIESIDVRFIWTESAAGWPLHPLQTGVPFVQVGSYSNPNANLGPGQYVPVTFEVPDVGVIWVDGTMTSRIELEPGQWIPVQAYVRDGHREIIWTPVSMESATWGRIKSHYR